MAGRPWELGRRLRAARIRRGFKVAQVSDYCGVRDETIYDWEKGVCVPDYPSLVLLAEALGLDEKLMTKGGAEWDAHVARLGKIPTPEWFRVPTQFPDELRAHDADIADEPFGGHVAKGFKPTGRHSPTGGSPSRARSPRMRNAVYEENIRLARIADDRAAGRLTVRRAAVTSYPNEVNCSRCGFCNPIEDRICGRCAEWLRPV